MSGNGLGSEIIGAVAGVLRHYSNPTAFAHSSEARHALRADLCLRGWPWTTAETLASETVSAALRRIGARTPTWAEGQPEWTQEGVLAELRTHCVNCNRPLPEDAYRYCSRLCASAWARKVADRDKRAWSNAVSAQEWRKKVMSKIPDARCRGCGTRFKPAFIAEKRCGTCR